MKTFKQHSSDVIHRKVPHSGNFYPPAAKKLEPIYNEKGKDIQQYPSPPKRPDDQCNICGKTVGKDEESTKFAGEYLIHKKCENNSIFEPVKKWKPKE